MQKINAHPPKSAVPCITPNQQKWLLNVEETMVWLSAGYIFLKSETKFQTPVKKALIWDPAIVSMIKTQLTIRQNVNKNKIQKFHFFSNCGLVLFAFLAIGALVWPQWWSFADVSQQGVDFSQKKSVE